LHRDHRSSANNATTARYRYVHELAKKTIFVDPSLSDRRSTLATRQRLLEPDQRLSARSTCR
jgi:hypothetical protein